MSLLEINPVMNPKKAECVGHYLYGSGWFAREDQQASIVRATQQESFCNECPLRERCQKEHILRVKANDPEAVEAFTELVRDAKKRGIPPALVEATLARQRRPDPFMAHALSNYKRGAADRKRSRLLASG